jgi:outer membrane lipase/esterase
VASALALGLATPAAAQFSGAYFFGDSLSDAGTYKPVLPAGTGLFTTNPGPIWATVFGTDYGFAVAPANQGGNDYAEGGARVSQPPLPGTSPPTTNAAPVSTQITRLLAKGPLDPNAVYFVWGGANDLLAQLTLAGGGAITPGQAQINLAQAATDLATQVARLQAAGARYIVVFNMPDVGRTPAGLTSGQTANITALSSFFNSTLTSALDATGVQAVRLNTFALLTEITSNPSAYGFANVTLPACGTTSSLVCTSANLVAPNAAQTFLFADGIHPTTAGHQIIAQYAEAVLKAPQQVAALAEAPIAAEQANFRSIDARMMSATNAPSRGNKTDAWAVYDYGNPDIKTGFASGDQKLNTATAGIDWKLSQRVLLGVAIGYTDAKVDLSQSGFKLKETTGTVYAGYGEGPWYLGGSLGASDLDYRDVHRDIPLGALTRTESGSTKGYSTTGRLLGGYWFNFGNIVHGPWARVTWQDIKVRQYSEDGSSSTTMSFDQQRRKSLITSLGWQAEGTFGAIRPFARASWEHEVKDDVREVGASVFGVGGHFSVPSFTPDKDYALFSLGAAVDIGRVVGFVYGSATSGKGDGNDKGITVGIRVPL